MNGLGIYKISGLGMNITAVQIVNLGANRFPSKEYYDVVWMLPPQVEFDRLRVAQFW
jgi:hypothetical protein